MPLGPGTRLGPYEIQSALGAGGMGEAYRARDTKLGRDVALKVVAESFAHDPERVARFQREAQLLASLNHPHIATIYGLEEAHPSTGSRRSSGSSPSADRSAGPPMRSAPADKSRNPSYVRSEPETERVERSERSPFRSSTMARKAADACDRSAAFR